MSLLGQTIRPFVAKSDAIQQNRFMLHLKHWLSVCLLTGQTYKKIKYVLH